MAINNITDGRDYIYQLCRESPKHAGKIIDSFLDDHRTFLVKQAVVKKPVQHGEIKPEELPSLAHTVSLCSGAALSAVTFHDPVKAERTFLATNINKLAQNLFPRESEKWDRVHQLFKEKLLKGTNLSTIEDYLWLENTATSKSLVKFLNKARQGNLKSSEEKLKKVTKKIADALCMLHPNFISKVRGHTVYSVDGKANKAKVLALINKFHEIKLGISQETYVPTDDSVLSRNVIVNTFPEEIWKPLSQVEVARSKNLSLFQKHEKLLKKTQLGNHETGIRTLPNVKPEVSSQVQSLNPVTPGENPEVEKEDPVSQEPNKRGTLFRACLRVFEIFKRPFIAIGRFFTFLWNTMWH